MTKQINLYLIAVDLNHNSKNRLPDLLYSHMKKRLKIFSVM